MGNLPQPVKLYYISPIFRYDRPQAGRYRQHHQFGCEVIGESDPAVDAQVIETAWRFYESLGLDKLLLKLNSIGCKRCRPSYQSALREYYTAHDQGLCPDCRSRMEKNALRLLDCKNESCRMLVDAAPRSADYLCLECAGHFKKLQHYLGLLGLPFDIDHRLVRGLDYYTRTVFEIQPEVEGGQSTIGGGGRYDGLIEELGGKPTPAIGFATGIERIILNLKRENIVVPGLPAPDVFIASLGDEAKEQGIKLASALLEDGIAVLEATGGRSLKAQLRQANSFNARFAIIIGEDELKTGTVVLRDMASAEQETVANSELKDKLAEKLKRGL
jgi:histidyl-tRNA synthetase